MSEEPTNGNARLYRIEREIENIRQKNSDDVKSLHDKIDSLITTISAYHKDQQVDKTKKDGEIKSIESHLCPKPGACASLEPRVKILEDKFSKWHDTQQQWKGAMKTVRTFWLGVGGILTTAAWLLKEYFTSN